MTWIKIDENLGLHPKIHALEIELKISKSEAVGIVVLLWIFTLKFAWQNADLSRFKPDVIAHALGWRGDASVLFDALRVCGWLDEHIVHDFYEYAGKLLKDRFYNQRRKTANIAVKLRKLRRTSTARLDKTRLDKTRLETTTPKSPSRGLESAVVLDLPKETKTDQKPEPKIETDIQKIVRGWKILNSIPADGPQSQAWDRVHFARHAKSAKSLIDLFGDWETASDAMEYVYMSLTAKKLSCTIETIVKHSDLYREYKEKGAYR